MKMNHPREGLIEKSLDLLATSLEVSKSVEDHEHIVLALGQIGILYMIKGTQIHDLNQAEIFLKDAHSKLTSNIQVEIQTKSKNSKSPQGKISKKEAEICSPRKYAKSLLNNINIKNQRIILDCIICLAYIYFDWHEWTDSQSYFK